MPSASQRSDQRASMPSSVGRSGIAAIVPGYGRPPDATQAPPGSVPRHAAAQGGEGQREADGGDAEDGQEAPPMAPASQPSETSARRPAST